MKIKFYKTLIFSLFLVFAWNLSFAYIPPPKEGKKEFTNTTINFREDCKAPKAQVDQNINNVRARLTSGGDVWWDQSDGLYVVPVPAPGEPEVSSIFAGAVWLGGQDNAGNLKVAATTYRRGNQLDFYSGPLDENGVTTLETCNNWDRFFKVEGKNIDKHIATYKRLQASGQAYHPDSIPEDIKYWPGRGNEYFTEKYTFELPDNIQGLGSFHDINENNLYEPQLGEYPNIEIRNCPPGIYPDEMFFWIYNDNGGPHTQSLGSPIQMEVQVQAFAWATNDEINDMTFQRYKLINRAISDIRDCYFAMWVDPDLGCHTDDYIGSFPSKDLAIVYNEDALDGTNGCTCDNGVNTYCDRIPLLGIDYFRGPLAPRKFDEFGEPSITPDIGEDGDTIIELGMTSLIYYNNRGIGTHPVATTDPDNAIEYYNYLKGLWKDGTAITRGGSGYNLGSTDSIKYVFPDAPNDNDGWSMYSENLGFGDRRTIQATGPFLLKPGAINELIIGAVWVPNQSYPAPDLTQLLVADDLAQTLFDNCFRLQNGPDAPDMDIIQLDRELVLVLSNDSLLSNNAFEAYREKGLKISEDDTDNLDYLFEGYQIYQLATGAVTVSELTDFEKARLIYQVDVKNDVTTLYNWNSFPNPSPKGGSEQIFEPVLKVKGGNQGIRNVFKVTDDQFASGDRTLINHKPYYFLVLAYGHNNWEEFNPNNAKGQREPYFAGRRNIKITTGIPRPIPYTIMNAYPGQGVAITRLDGNGTGSNFVRLAEGEHDRILAGQGDGTLRYATGEGPLNIRIFNPFDVKNKSFRLDMYDENMTNAKLDNEVNWLLTDLSNNKVYKSDKIISTFNEQIIFGEGFSVMIEQVAPPASQTEESNGVLGSELAYKDPEGVQWFKMIRDDMGYTYRTQGGQTVDGTNFLKTGNGETDQIHDPDKTFSNIGPAPFIPFWLAGFADGEYISPAYRYNKGHDWVRKANTIDFTKQYTRFGRLNNVDIVFTSDKSKWSRCAVVESSPGDIFAAINPTEGNVNQFDLRKAPSVGKEADANGLPVADGDGTGMGWFPGYAIDVETGQRLNIFFGENSSYGGMADIDTLFVGKKGVGRDMMFNPSEDDIIPYPFNLTLGFSPWNIALGGHHFLYVMNTPYDECAALRESLNKTAAQQKSQQLKFVTWAGIVMSQPGTSMLSYKDGLIPNDVTVNIRITNPYEVKSHTGQNNGYGSYIIDLNGTQAEEIVVADTLDNPLNMVNVTPNPYYAYSAYETSQFTQRVKITNLPGKCTVTIYSLDGKFVRQFKRDEKGIDYTISGRSNPAINKSQIYPDIEWDLKNSRGIPIASGIYLIHIYADDLGAERTIKWFGINRQFDPTGL